MTRDKIGFTIVELLIVIVVIGILATITVVAYNGVQQRARLSAVGAQIGNYQKMIKLYQLAGKQLPDEPACLGTPEVYITDPKDGTNQCGISGQDGNVNTAFNSGLADEGLTDQQLLPLDSANERFVFSPWGYYEYDQPIILYTLPGAEQPCTASPVISENASGVWGAHGESYSENNSTYTLCIVGI